MRRWLRDATSLAAAGMLAACTVGPRYQPPAAPSVGRYTATSSATIPGAPHAGGSAAQGQTLESGAAVDARWWTAFGSPALDRLVTQALGHNPTLAAAQATLEQSQEELRAARGIFYPQVGLDLGAERTHASGAATGGNFGSQTFNLYTGSVGVSYYPDVFGLNRLVTREQQARVDIARNQLDAARLMIAGNVVNTVFDLAALNDAIAATRHNVHSQQQALTLIRTQYQLGAVAQFQVFTQESLLASSQAQLTQFEQARDAAHHLLATYLGEFPADAGALDLPTLAQLKLPTTLPLSLPSALVRQRPDIRAAEAQLRAANAQVGEAAARMYPNLQLTADIGTQVNFTHLFFDPATPIWDVAASLAAPLFEGGSLRAQKRAAEAAYRAMFANYRGAVLGAFRSVADVLRALQHDSALLDAQARALHAAQHALRLMTTEYQAGQVDYVSLLASETQVQSASIAFVNARAQRLADTAALYVALGGGRWDELDTRTAAASATARRADAPPGR